MSFVSASAPENIFLVINRGFVLFTAAFPKVIVGAMLLAVLLCLPNLAILYHDQTTTFIQTNPERHLLITRSAGIVYLLLMIIIPTNLIRIMGCVHNGLPESVEQSTLIALKKIPRIILAGVFKLIFLGMIAAPFIAIYFFMWRNSYLKNYVGLLETYAFFLFVFVNTLIITQHEGAFSSVKKSICLVWGNWLRTFFTLTLPGIITIVFCGVIFYVTSKQLGYTIPQNMDSKNLVSIKTIIAGGVFWTFFLPWLYGCLLTLLHDIQLRQEIRAI